MQKTSKAPKKNVLKSLFHKTPKDIRKMEGSKLEALDGATLKESSSSEPNCSEKKEKEILYVNTTELVCKHDRRKIKDSKEGDPDKENPKSTKTKPMVLPKPKTGSS